MFADVFLGGVFFFGSAVLNVEKWSVVDGNGLMESVDRRDESVEEEVVYLRELLEKERCEASSIREQLFDLYDDLGVVEEKLADVQDELSVVRQSLKFLKQKMRRLRLDGLKNHAEVVSGHEREVTSLKEKLKKMEKEVEVNESGVFGLMNCLFCRAKEHYSFCL